MPTQLRRYAVTDGGLDAVIEFFKEIRALREQFGFVVEFAVADRDRSEFVWAVSHPDWEAANSKYEASADREQLFAGRFMPILSRDIRMVELIHPHAEGVQGEQGTRLLPNKTLREI